MATDYNKILLDKGYTQAQIDAMRNTASSGGSQQDIVKAGQTQTTTTTPKTSTTNQTSGMNSMSQSVAQNNSRNAQVGTGDVVGIQQNQTKSTPTTTPGATGNQIDMSSLQQSWDKLSASQQATLMKRKDFADYINSKGLTVKKEETPVETTTTTKPTAQKTTTTAQTPKQQQWDYQDNSQARMDEIARNLNGFRQTNPELFQDPSTFYGFFIDGKGRSQDQIDYLWNYYDRVKKYSKYDNMPASSLGEGLANGTIPQDYLDYIKGVDPQKYQEILSYKQDGEDRIKNESYLEDLTSMAGYESEESEVPETSDPVTYAKKMGYFVDENGDWIDDNSYIKPTDEERQDVDRINEIIARRMEIKNMQKNLLDDLVEQYPGVPKATLMGIVQDRTKDISREYDDLGVELAQLQGTVDYLQNERDMQASARQDTINNLSKAYGMYYSYSPEGIAELAQSQYAATNITLDQADSGNETQKQMALEAAITPIFEQYGDIIQRSPAQVINDVIAYAKKNGMGLRQALEENFMKPLREKPAYKNIQAQLSSPTPETVKMGDEGYYWDATTQSWKPITGGGTSGYMYSSVDWSVGTGKSESRTERNNNPTAMTTDVAKSLGMVEGVDYVQGDSFKDKYGKTLYTAKLLGDPIQTTIDAFNAAASRGTPIFYTRDGAQRWTHTAMSNEEWLALSDEQKAGVIAQMLQREGGQMGDMAYYVENGIPTTKSEGGAGGTDGKVTPEDLADWNSGVDKLFEANVLSGIPIQLRNTNVEKEYYLSIIDELYKQGITDVFEASQMINGFVINNTSVRAVAAQKQVLDVLKATAGKGALPSEALQAIASDINNGNYSGAYKRLETVMGEFAYNTKIPSVQTYTPQGMGGAMTAISAIEKISPLGWKTGKLENYLKGANLQSSIATEIGGNLTSLGEALVDMGFNEVAVYGGETSGGQKIVGLLPTIDDNSAVFKQKLSNIENIIVRNTNQWREAYGLPEINKQQLFSGEYNSLYGLDKGLRRPYGSSSSNSEIQGDSLFNVGQ